MAFTEQTSVLDYVPILALQNNGSKGKSTPRRPPRSYVQRIVEFTIDEKEDHSTEYSWKIAHVEGIDTANPEDVFVKERDVVLIKFGWIGRLSKTHEAIVIAIEPDYGTSGISHVVRLRDHSVRLQNKQAQAAHAGKKVKDIVKGIADSATLTCHVVDTSGVVRPIQKVPLQSLPPELNQSVTELQPGMNDHQMLKALAKKADYRVRIKGDKLFFEKPDYGASPARLYVWRSGKGNFLSFKPHSNLNSRNKAAATETKVVGVATDTKKKIEGKASADKKAGDPVLGKGDYSVSRVSGDVAWDPNHVSGKLIPHPSSDKAHVQDRAKDVQARAGAVQIQATLEVYGDPLLERSKIIRIAGVDRKNNGPWRIITCKQTIGLSGFKTSLGIHRHGHNSVKKGETKTAGKPNTNQPAGERVPTISVSIVNGAEKED